MNEIKSTNKNIIVTLRKCILLILAVIVVFLAVPKSSNSAYADMGPKPSVNITFNNMGDELCYGTLLSKNQSTGPYSVWEENYENIPDSFTREIWQSFVDYKDIDGYYFLQVVWQCNENKKITWGYYPPKNFKILLYYPESDTFIVSGSYERYAFNSYYTVNMDNINITSVDQSEHTINAVKSYNYFREILSLIIRLVITILLEIGIAFLFGLRKKGVLGIIVITNIVTQILLNVALNIILYYEGFLVFILLYVLFEIIVFIIEAIVYAITFRRYGVKLWKSTLYALISNAISFGAGLLLAALIMS